jgi:hypothetical protein
MTKLINEAATPTDADHALTVEPHTGEGANKSRKTKSPRKVTRKFALTETESERLVQVRKTCAEAGIVVSKQKLLRAAISLLAAQPPARLALQQQALAPVKGKKARKD